jgi:hypothetical protein
MSEPSPGPDAPDDSVAALRDALAVEHRHSRTTTAIVLALAVLLAWYASWLAADLGLGTVAFVLVAAVGAYCLYRQPTRSRVLAAALYALAAMLALTPVFMNLPFHLDAGAYGVENATAFTVRLADAIVLVVFLVLAAVPVAAARRLARS